MNKTASRRQFLQTAAAYAVGFAGLQMFATGCSTASKSSAKKVGYGALRPDPDKILDLPKGFKYSIISRTGDSMTDGLLVPSAPDGMATFAGPNGLTILIRNHEVGTTSGGAAGAFGKDFKLRSKLKDEQFYDAGRKGKPCQGGTSTIVFNTRTQAVVSQYLSLTGTVRNCAGGPTPWNSWITCEESVELAGVDLDKNHGFNFEVPASVTPMLADPVPLKAMGRFNHEAVAVDPKSGIVYETEDRPDSLIYRFIPTEAGKFAKGGKLQALVFVEQKSIDTRNWKTATVAPGKRFAVSWVDIENVDGRADDLRYRGFTAGAARFARGEGMWYGNGEIYFACTSGGKNQKGQIWRYRPSPYEGSAREKEAPGEVELFIEPNDDALVDNADNLTVSPWGDLVICEDGKEDQFLVGVTPQGEIYKLGHNPYTISEFAGVTFSPDGTTLFVNIQKAGMTLAITGPWKKAAV
ncbi:MAG: phosphatase [Verrucomicrobia bacterium]|jgi:secreted PhoX family phosphatase|nr:phosphatase [Verrucomicrobiota bacterium]